MLFTPIHPMDIGIIEGSYGIPGVKAKESFPQVAGNDGVGEVIEVGSDVKTLKSKDRVIPAKSGLGTWRTYGVFNESDVQFVPKDIDPQYAANLSVNPATAVRLLDDFVNLKSGDVIIQNGASSAVGRAVIQIAKERGIKTVNIIRADRNAFDTATEGLKSIGGYIVVSDHYMYTPAFRRLISDLPQPKLALNSQGGQTATEMLRFLGTGGTMVTYGATSRKHVTIPTSHLLFKELSIRGFWLSRWYDSHTAEERKAMMETIFNYCRKDQLKMHLETWRFDQFKEAMFKAKHPLRERKIIMSYDAEK